MNKLKYLLICLAFIGCNKSKKIEVPDQDQELPGIYQLVIMYKDSTLKLGWMTYEQFDFPPCLSNDSVYLYYPIGKVFVADNAQAIVWYKK